MDLSDEKVRLKIHPTLNTDMLNELQFRLKSKVWTIVQSLPEYVDDDGKQMSAYIPSIGFNVALRPQKP